MIKCILLCAFAIHQMDNPVLNVEFIGRKALEEYSSIFRNMLSIRGNENMSWHLEWHSFIHSSSPAIVKGTSSKILQCLIPSY